MSEERGVEEQESERGSLSYHELDVPADESAPYGVIAHELLEALAWTAEQVSDEPLLGVIVVGDGGAGYSDDLRDISQADSIEAALADELTGRLKNPVAGAIGALHIAPLLGSRVVLRGIPLTLIGCGDCTGVLYRRTVSGRRGFVEELMQGILAKYGHFAARRPIIVIAVWAACMVLVGAAAVVVGQARDDTVTLPGSESAQVQDIRSTHFATTSKGSGSIVVASDSLDLRTSEGSAELQRMSQSVAKVAHVTQVSASPSTVSQDGSIAYLAVSLDLYSREITKPVAQDVLDAAANSAPDGVSVLPGGQLAVTLAHQDTHSSEVIGLVAAAIVLLLSMGTAVAMSVPIGSAIVGLLVGMAGIAVLSQLSPIPTVAGTIATMLSLGVGIDYALFLVTRFRELRRDGRSVPDAVSTALARSGSAVLFAGITVMIALSGLWLAGVPFLGSLSWVAAIGVLGAMLTCLLLLPAVLGLLGDRLERWPLRRRLPWRPLQRADSHGLWERIGVVTTRHPWVSIVASLVLLGVLAAPATLLQLGQTDDGNAPANQVTRQSYDTLEQGFGPGINGPLIVVADVDAASSDSAASSFGVITAALKQTPGVQSVAGPQLSADRRAVQWTVIPTTAPSNPGTASLVAELREHTLPAAQGNLDLLVGGQTAAKADFAQIISARLVPIILAVIAASAVLLLVAFRSIAIPLTAAAMNVVSIVAAYGVLVFVFQEGHGIRFTGLDGPVPIEAFVPLLLFAVLFGLSMDYQVFLLSAIQEQWQRFGDNRRAVIAGIGGTGRVITSAALIMVCVFISFIPTPDPVVKMFGLGMAVAVLVDATIVRGLLVPALMALLGRANWWAPRWLMGSQRPASTDQ